MKARRALAVTAVLVAAPLAAIGWWSLSPEGVKSSGAAATVAPDVSTSKFLALDVLAPGAPTAPAEMPSGSRNSPEPAEAASTVPTEQPSTSVDTEPPGLVPAASAASVSPTTVLDYQTGDFSQWAELQVARPEQARVVTSPARAGTTYSARFTVTPEDHVFGDAATIRGEVRADPEDAGTPAEGMQQWYAWSTYFPPDFEWDGEWLSYTQWHQTTQTGPPVIALLVTPGPDPRLRLTVRGGVLQAGVQPRTATYDLGPLQRGVWLDHKVFVHWSSEPRGGRIGVSINGAQVLTPTAVANLYVGQSAYLKQGLYGSASTNRSHTVYHTATRIGPTETSVTLP